MSGTPYGSRFVPGIGPQPSRVLLVGEGPGKDEDRWGKPFIGKSGKELTRYLSNEGLDREDIRIANLVCYRMPNDDDPTPLDMDRDQPILDRDLADTQPQVIGLIGRVAARRFLGDIDMEWGHGLPFTQNFYPMTSHGPREFSPVLMPLYHPAYGLYTPGMTPLVQDDFHQFARLVRGELDLTPRVDLYPDPEYKLLTDTLPLFLVDKPIYIDTEGWQDNPWGLSFTQTPGRAYVILGHNADLLRRLADTIDKLDLLVVFHNEMHDLPIVQVMGLRVHRHRDTMIRAHHLCVEPQGLKPLARRHASMEMQSYDEMTHEAGYQKALDYLEKVFDLLV